MNKILALAFMAAMLCVHSAAWADDSEKGLSDLAPAATSTEDTIEDIAATHPAIRMTPDKSELVRLDRDAASVIVGNPEHISVLLDTPRLLVVVPRGPGASYFTVLDQNRDIIMQRHVIVASPKEKYVRVRRSCAVSDAQGLACAETSVYYCPDMCHEISMGQGGEEGNNSGPPPPSE